MSGAGRLRSPRWPVWTAAAAAVLAWAPFVAAPPSPDEGGFLLVASQWRPGDSLYGHYWVDRPPLLLTLFDLATHVGGLVGLRVIGIVAVVVSVLLSSRIATRSAARGVVGTAVVAAVFLSTPLFGTTEVDGELLAVPLVLTGVLALVRAWPASGRSRAVWCCLAGASGMAAALVKQNVVDVFVVAVVVVALSVRSVGLRRAAASVAAVAVGAAALLSAMLVVAEVRGTEPFGLWDALVVFRAQATAVIEASSTSATSARFVSLLVAALLSGAPLLVGVLVLRLRGPASEVRAPDLRWPAVALLGWEALGVVGGGSYWLHYLIGLVPGLVLLSVAAAQRPPRLQIATAAAVAITALSATGAVLSVALAPPELPDDVAVSAYLRDHSTAHDTVVVGFGHPDIVYASGLRSPYRELWSLPVRVRDPQLHHLTHLLDGRRAPTWVVVSGSSLATWGVDATHAEATLDARYRPATEVGSYVVWRRIGA